MSKTKIRHQVVSDQQAVRVVLVGLELSRGDGFFDPTLEELALLAQSAGFEVAERVTCRRAVPDPALFVGSGKADEIAAVAAAAGAEEVLFDQALSPAQQRNLERRMQLAVNDRTMLILDIFAQRARSHEGKLQVELARLQYLSTRLVRRWTHLERQRGGIGARGGPGERQIELDRRMINVAIERNRKRLKQVKKQRTTQRRQRVRRGVFAVSLVGYTNAGKSTLFNALVKARSLTADKLFATLDTSTRQLYLGAEAGVVSLSDTVGFIRALPHGLVDAFAATLQEAVDADLLLHVVDASNPDWLEQMESVQTVLHEIGAGELEQLLVFNKCDRLSSAAASVKPSHSDAVDAAVCMAAEESTDAEITDGETADGKNADAAGRDMSGNAAPKGAERQAADTVTEGAANGCVSDSDGIGFRQQPDTSGKAADYFELDGRTLRRCYVSARTGQGLDSLRTIMADLVLTARSDR